jgi:hypothetical protein
MAIVCKLVFSTSPQSLNLLESFAFRFRQASLDKYKPGHTNYGVDPECPRGTERVIKEGESIS